MLIDKGITDGEVVTLKLVSGDELICKLVEQKDKSYKVRKPLLLSLNPQGMGMIPFMFTVDQEKDVEIFKDSVMSIQVTDKQFASQYMQGTTGLALG
jgi:hypothetical protein